MGASRRFDAPVKIRVPRAFLSGASSRSPSKSPTKGGPAASVTGSTKAGIQAALSPQPTAGQIAISAATESADVLPQAERYFFNPVNTGSFPPKPALTKTIDGVHGSQSHTFAPSISAVETAVEQTGKSANDARALEMPIKHNRALPLELFDNPETEVVPPEDRINSRPSGQPGAPARSRFYDSKGDFAWAPCYVIAYDRPQERFQIQWQDSGNQKWVKRFNLLFEDESIDDFKSRIQAALRRRQEVERDARYKAYVDQQPWHNMDTLDEAFQRRVMHLAGWELPQKLPVLTQSFLSEVKTDYQHAVKEGIVDLGFQNPSKAAQLTAHHIDQVKVVHPIPEQGCVNLDKACGHSGRVVSGMQGAAADSQEVARECWADLKGDVQHTLSLAQPKLLKGIQLYFAELDVQSMLLVDTQMKTLRRPAALSDFLQCQEGHLGDVVDALRSDWLLKAWLTANHSLEDTQAEMARLQGLTDAVLNIAEPKVTFRLIQVDCSSAKASILQQAVTLRQGLQHQVAAAWTEGNRAVSVRYNTLCSRLQLTPETTEAMDEQEKFMASTAAELSSLAQQIAASQHTFEVLQSSQYITEEEESDVFWGMRRWPNKLAEVLEETAKMLKRHKQRFLSDLHVDQQKLRAQLEVLRSDVESFSELGDIAQVDERLGAVQDLEARLKQTQEMADLFTNRERIFDLPPSPFPALAASSPTTCRTGWTAPLWPSMLSRWPQTVRSAKIGKAMAGPAAEVLANLRGKLEGFQEHLPLIKALRNPGLRDRHWDKISQKVGVPVKADASFSVTRALQLQLPKQLAVLEEVSEYASREYSLERALDKMQGDWAGVAFDTLEWRATGTCILRGLDDIQTLLDDQIVKTQGMRASPYIGPFEERVRLWEAKLNLMQEIMDEWLKCQQGWLYLEPIFGSEDILQQMPNEGRKFRAVDATWRHIMAAVRKAPEVLLMCSDDELLKNLIEANKFLEQVQKGLNDYLETKRLAFPRFYFLSNDELLEILSETKDPLRVQPFLRKIFEGIDKLEFAPDLEVTAMLSEEGEKLSLKTTFNPKAAGGNVEKWFIEAEAAMRETVRDVTRKSFDAHAVSKRIDWVLQWPGQVVLCVGSMFWTQEVAESIRSNSLPAYSKKCTDDLLDVVNKVRGKLSKLERKTLSALIVVDVHARDVATELAAQGVSSETDFEWMSQLRYYWENDEVMVRMINAAIGYGYEYLGNSSRLVITPLTDRCYRTLMGALHLNLGGAPEGPAGTGKTETTKDLAKAMAMQCVVFNCSDGLDYLAMGKFFKGLASAGAWACFDEFNRIDLEVLSVIAQQILTIQRAKAAKVATFEFEGTRLSLRATCSVFITMNPGYAGRSELPDNLKALFRTVAMMVPDYALISEIMLYSSGYLQARELARKLVATYRLCSEQLSSQSHYDYGMRAVISVLRAAGANKQKWGDMAEELLMLRSIRDVNQPKFLAPDIPLFEGILADLFPGVTLPEPDYKDLDECLRAACKAANLQATPVFMEKAHQLYEMMLVRHGLMVVGYSFAAKTSIYRMLAAALGDLHNKKLMDENKVQLHVMNPKSITMGQLYGQFDPVSHEWKDGVLAKLFRECATDPSPDRKWVLFDGPVDAVWIENMNTVLDDNKKLCLNSGEIVQMSASMNMIFEVQDLVVASPATVSRCGMVYVEPSQMGWRPLRDSWMQADLPAALTQDQRSHMHTLFEWLVDPCIAFVRRNCRELVTTADINLPVSLMNLFSSLLDRFKPNAAGEPPVLPAEPTKLLEGLFIFSLIWSIGATTETAGRTLFNHFLRKLLRKGVEESPERTEFDLGPGVTITTPEFDLRPVLPVDGSVHDYVFDQESCDWVHWTKTVPAQELPPTLAFHEIIVQTIDTVRYSYLMRLLITHGHHTLFTGATGTGKTVYMTSQINALDSSVYQNIQTAFSAQTSANQIQDIIDLKLDKRRKGIYGPPFGQKCVIFVDDLNMPSLETYGAQPPVELLRQWMDHQGWYDRSDNSWRSIVDVLFCAAMGPPGGGRNNVTPRYLRHFNLIAISDFDDETYSHIYTSIIGWWHQKAGVAEEVASMGPAIVSATVDIYQAIKRDLLPTPAKSHYTYNMRDLSKVFQGIAMVGVDVDTPEKMARLWAHEALRIFHDRLVNDDDRRWFGNYLKAAVQEHLHLNFDEVFAKPDSSAGAGQLDVLSATRSLLYCNFLTQGADNQKYEPVTDQARLLTCIEGYLAEYNLQNKTRMDLVLFLYAAEHICRISRIIKQPFGNALLVGVGGSGRQSLTRIATFMAEYSLFTIEISKSYSVLEWQEDLRTVLRKAGSDGQPTVFLFSDNQLKDESFLEDINNILNMGEVPNLFAKDEVMTIIEAVTPKAKRAGRGISPPEVYAYFVEQCRANLHMVLAMSPVGDAFRARLRKFPSLVNCCTIDWFSEWPADALKSVASQFLKDVEMPSDAARESVEGMCMLFHTSVRTLASDFLTQLQRHYYATPTSYLELISTYKHLLAAKRTQVYMLKHRYEAGLQKLLAAEGEVNVMKEELIQLQPKLIATGKEVEETLVVVNSQTEAAVAQKAVVQAEEAAASEKAAAAKAIKDECEGELAVAMPLLERALQALNTLTKGDITEVKSMKNPPSVVKLVMESVCHMLGVKPKKVQDPTNPSKKVDDYWEGSQKLLGESGFLQKLQTYDKDNIPPEVIVKIRPYMDNPDFEPEVVKKASKAAYGLVSWVRAMEAYDRVAKVVAPKKEKLAAAEGEYSELMTGLNQKKAELAAVEANLAALNAKLKEMQDQKQQLERDVDLCSKKLDRATKLIGGLGGEKTRWTEVAEKLGKDYINLTGDVLLSAAFIAYLGAFTGSYRERATSLWTSECQGHNIPCSSDFCMAAVLGEPVQIREWVIQGLPNDSFSIDNATIGQANKWIRNKERRSQLEVLKLTEPDYMRRLENAIQFGNPVLLEGVGQELDPTLEPLLLKSTFKQGGSMCIRLGDSTIEYSEQFRFYITTALRNPHYLPEVAVKVTLLNFMITPEGLEDQLLGIVVQRERPELEEEKTKLTLQACCCPHQPTPCKTYIGADNARQLAEIEDKIIEVLSGAEGNILENETAITVITASKTLSNDINQKQQIAQRTEKKIDEARLGYKPVARHVAVLFFNISELANIEPMYQYSLVWFVNLFEDAIKKAAPSDTLATRISSLVEYVTYSLYCNVCRSLFEKDKLLFSFMLCISIKANIDNTVDMEEFRFLLTGGISAGEVPPNPLPWLGDKLWAEMNRLSSFLSFVGFAEELHKDPTPWKAIFDSANPAEQPLPEPWEQNLTPVQKLMVLRVLRPDKLVLAVQRFVLNEMGSKFVEAPPFDLDKCYQDSTCLTPLIFVLSPGSDPMSGLLKYADSLKVKVDSISLGQGQGPKAEKLIQAAAGQGGWVVLQNCHLAVSWMPSLERLCAGLTQETTHPAFRLWLTSYPSPHFPVAVLQNGIKMTNEPPKGLRANLMQSYLNDPVSDPAFFNNCQQPTAFKKLLFGLCFFHAFVQERLKFGPLGWNVQYQFSLPDFVISVRQLQMFLNEFQDAVPLKALAYLTGECNYGGRVTDSHDRRTLTSILSLFYTPAIFDSGYQFSPSGLYRPPPDGDYQTYLEYIKALPLSAEPEVFGLHGNADITKDQQEADLMLTSCLAMQGSATASGGTSRDSLLTTLAADIDVRLPGTFDIEAVRYKYPVDYNESMNTVLCQELVRFNGLVEVIHASLKNLQKALKGQVVMSADLEQVGNAMYDGRVPSLWMAKSYPSMKPLGSYVTDLIERLNMLNRWIEHGPPAVFWISGFYFTHAFLTGVKQNFARRHKVPIDTVVFDYVCMPPGEQTSPPSDGAYISGMYVEGARWDPETMMLAESLPKVLYSAAPIIHLVPCQQSELRQFPQYECPLYCTPERRGVLATTGHSTNFVMDLMIPSDRPQDHWCRRGVAFLLSLAG
ncbi:MAG: dynein heavy chain axonemal [Trebouxia sp. A1-2]|nr:MAG: dynein heavy chain axonemal [Trebouxia sp. A1-2]